MSSIMVNTMEIESFFLLHTSYYLHSIITLQELVETCMLYSNLDTL